MKSSLSPAGNYSSNSALNSLREHRTFLLAILGLMAVCFLAGLAVGYQWGKPEYEANLLAVTPKEDFRADSLAPEAGRRDEIVNYANTFLGTPYRPRGQGNDGFDCSGYVAHVFSHFNLQLPPSTAYLIKEGQEVAESEAKPGDLIFFTGTAKGDPQVGHVGIVVLNKGNDIKFIHASSAPKTPYVKYDSLTRPNYRRRFLVVKRVLNE